MGIRITDLPAAVTPIDPTTQFVVIDNGTEVRKTSVLSLQNSSETASNIIYDNTVSELDATNVQNAIDELVNRKVEKVSGKGLSTNDYTTVDKTKLSGIQDNAQVNVQSDWNQSDVTADDYIKNKPSIPPGVIVDPTVTSESTNPVTSGGIYEALLSKVDVEEGKSLSTNDFTDAYKTKLDGIETGAQVNTISSITLNGREMTPDPIGNVSLSAATRDPGTNAVVTVVNPEGPQFAEVGAIWIETDEA